MIRVTFDSSSKSLAGSGRLQVYEANIMNDETAKRGEHGARSRRVSAMTNLVHSGSPSAKAAGLLNPPVHRASTITYDSVEAYTGRHSRILDDESGRPSCRVRECKYDMISVVTVSIKKKNKYHQ